MFSVEFPLFQSRFSQVNCCCFLDFPALALRIKITEMSNIFPTSTALDPVPKGKVWTTLITNTKYLSGLLTLEHSLRRVGSKYPLLVLYTETFEEEGHKALDIRGITKRKIEYLLPKAHKDYSNDTRFYDCWSKLQPFSLFEYERVIQLDSDMVVLRNMDELMDIPLNDETRVFAAAHACVCNPYHKEHYPKDWVAANCANTKYYEYCSKYKSNVLQTRVLDGIPSPLCSNEGLLELGISSESTDTSSESNSTGDDSVCVANSTAATSPATLDHEYFLHAYGPGPSSGLGICNGGLQVVAPSRKTYKQILNVLSQPSTTNNYDFADQSLLSDLFRNRWVPLSYKYNALKTLKTIHPEVWDDSEVANLHYILNPKPWDVRHLSNRLSKDYDDTETFKFWFKIDDERLETEAERGISDGF